MKSQADRVLDVLTTMSAPTIQEIHQQVGPCRLNSRIAELRKRGHNIVCSREQVTPRFGFGKPETVYRYRLIKPLGSGESHKQPMVPPSWRAADAELTHSASSPEPNGNPLDSATPAPNPLSAVVADSSGVVQPAGIGRAREAEAEHGEPHATSEAVPLETYGLDKAIREANAETPGLLVEPARELSLDENRRRLAELQQTLWGRAA